MKKAQRNQEWPQVLYMTPDKWSCLAEVHVVDERELRQMVRELRKLGEDWRKVSVLDATPIRLVKVQDDDTAIYAYGIHTIYGGGEFYRVGRYRLPDGGVHYEWCELGLCEEER